jgi:integrase
LADIQTKFDVVLGQLQEKIDQEHLIKKQRIERKNRKLQPIRQPITKENYEIPISESEVILYESRFRGARLRLALVLLLVTGIRISELLPLKLYQIKTLFVEHWIEIDRAKRGPSSHKAFLTKEGINILRKRLIDLEIMSSYKSDNCYIFTAQGSNKPLDREAFNRIVNQFIKKCAFKIPGKPNLKSHSFRIGFITQLSRDTNDIEFVRQAIGHAKINTTSEYVENLSDEERKSKLEQVKSPKDLIMNPEDFDT